MNTCKKKIIGIFLMILWLCILGHISIFSDAIIEQDEELEPKTVIQILDDQISAEEKSALLDHNKYVGDMKNKDISDKTILRVYRWTYDNLVAEPLQKVVPLADEYDKENEMFYYIVLDEQPYVIISCTKEGKHTVSIMHDYNSQYPSYIRDILQLSETVKIEGEEHKIQEIYCFDDELGDVGIAVYLKTDKGVFVNFYYDSTDEPKLVTEAEFMRIGRDTIEYFLARKGLMGGPFASGIMSNIDEDKFLTLESKNPYTKVIKNKSTEALIDAQLTKEERDMLENESAYTNMKNKYVTGRVVLRKYCWENTKKQILSLDEAIKDSCRVNEESKSTQYIVFDNKPYVISNNILSQDKYEISLIHSFGNDVPIYIEDIFNMPSVLTMGNTEYNVQGIYLFDNGFSDQRASDIGVYIKTDKGVLVRVYKNDGSAGRWFTEEEFILYAKLYNRFIDTIDEPERMTYLFLNYVEDRKIFSSLGWDFNKQPIIDEKPSVDTSNNTENKPASTIDPAIAVKPEDGVGISTASVVASNISDKKPTTSEQSANVSQASEGSNTTIVMFSIGCIAMFALALIISMIAAKRSEKNSDK